MNRTSSFFVSAGCGLLMLTASLGCSSKPYSVSGGRVVEAHIAPGRTPDMEHAMGSYSVAGFSDKPSDFAPASEEADAAPAQDFFPTGAPAMERFEAFTRWWPSNKPYAAIGGLSAPVGGEDENAVAIVDRPEGTFVYVTVSLSNEWVLNTTGQFSGVLTFKDFELVAGNERLLPLLVSTPDAQNRNNTGVEYPSSMTLEFGRLEDSVPYSSSTLGSMTVRCLFPRPADLSNLQLKVLGNEGVPVKVKGASASKPAAAPAASPAAPPPPPPPPPGA